MSCYELIFKNNMNLFGSIITVKVLIKHIDFLKSNRIYPPNLKYTNLTSFVKIFYYQNKLATLYQNDFIIKKKILYNKFEKTVYNASANYYS